MGIYANTPFADIDLDALAERAERIYSEQYKEEFERKYWGQYVKIDLNTGKAYVGKTEKEAREKAHNDAPKGFYCTIGVGFDASIRMLTRRHG